MLALVEIPEHSDTILASGRGERAIRRYRHGINVPCVTVVVGLQLEF